MVFIQHDFCIYRALKRTLRHTGTLAFCIVLCSHSIAQEKDTVPIYHSTITNIFHAAINAVSKSPGDSAIDNNILNIKSRAAFSPYAGKGIRHITIKQLGFEKTFADTSHGSKYEGSRLLNKLHRNSRQWVIRNNLFIKEKTALDPYELADNERYLRTCVFFIFY